MNQMKPNGFTLIEVMIVVAIVGILASIAYPSYVEYIRRAARAECEGTMMAAANSLERRFSTTNSYLPDTLPGPSTCPADGGTAKYNLSLSTAAPTTETTFTIQAIPVVGSAQASDKCGTLTLTEARVKGNSAGLPVNECWR